MDRRVWRYLIGRLISSLVVLFMVVSLTFVLIQVAPGGLSILMDPNMPAAEVERLSRNLGLDRPPHLQYLSWLRNVVQGDLGASLSYGGRPVREMIFNRIPPTVLLGASAAGLSLLLGIPLGIYAARNQNRWGDQLIGFFTFLGLATPNFWLGILMIVLFSVQLGWLPASGVRTIGMPFDLGDRILHLLMPALVLATGTLAEMVRYTRSSWLGVMKMDYVQVARAKGVSERSVHYRHVMKNALIPVLTVFGVSLSRLVGGSAIVETLFSWPGVGQLAVDAALRRDTPLILGITIVVSLAVVLSNLLIDLIYPLLDPRIRYA